MIDASTSLTSPSRSQVSEVLVLVASPLFLTMSLVAAFSNDPANLFCGSMHGGVAGSMSLMYFLMGVVHSAPWLRRRRGERS